MPATRGSATFATSAYSATNVIASQTSWEAKVSFWNGGKAGLWPAEGTSVCAVVSAMIRSAPLPRHGSEREQQQQRDQQREDAERLGDREAEDEVAELALRGRRVAQRRGEIIAEDRAHPDARAAHADTVNAGADVFCSNRIHVENSSLVCCGKGR